MVEQDYERALDSLKQDVRELRAAFTRWAKEDGQRHVTERLEAMKEHVREGMERGLDWAKGALHGVQDQSHKVVENTKAQVTAHPWLSVLGAVAAGIIVDRLLTRR